MAYLGGLLDVESETVTLEGIPGTPCSIDAIACESEWIKVEKHDDVTFTVRRSDAAHPRSQDSPVTHVEIDIEYETDGMPLTVKEHFPVYVTPKKEGGVQ